MTMAESLLKSSPTGLDLLSERLHQDLEQLCLPAEDWLQRNPDDATIDVAIVGGGMSGLTAAAALQLAGVRRVRIFDVNPPGQEGPWVTHARMQTLRSPKHLTGPALGIPSLTFRAWYAAQYGAAAWDALGRIPRTQWQDYLNWYRTVLALPVSHHTRVESIQAQPLPDGTPGLKFDAISQTEDANTHTTLQARHVVLATGMDGLGGPAIPPEVKALPRNRWQHTSESIDFSALRGKRIGVWGGGDSALDAAATAAEQGAQTVDVFIRSGDFSRINYWKAFTHPGHAYGFATLSADARLPLLEFLKQQKVPPSQDTVRRIAEWRNIRLHFSSPVLSLQVDPADAVRVRIPYGEIPLDHLVLATGYATNLAARPELADLAQHIRFWNHRQPPPPATFALDSFPDLAPDFALQEQVPGNCPALERVHLFTGAALLSHGKLTGDIPGITLGAQRLTQGIIARLYAGNQAHQLQQLKDYAELEVQGTEWAANRVDHGVHP